MDCIVHGVTKSWTRLSDFHDFIPKQSCLFFFFFKQKVVFCSVKEALEVDWSSDKAKAALKRTTPDYFLLQGEP